MHWRKLQRNAPLENDSSKAYAMDKSQVICYFLVLLTYPESCPASAVIFFPGMRWKTLVKWCLFDVVPFILRCLFTEFKSLQKVTFTDECIIINNIKWSKKWHTFWHYYNINWLCIYLYLYFLISPNFWWMFALSGSFQSQVIKTLSCFHLSCLNYIKV